MLFSRCTPRLLTATIPSRRSRVRSVTWSRGWKRRRLRICTWWPRWFPSSHAVGRRWWTFTHSMPKATLSTTWRCWTRARQVLTVVQHAGILVISKYQEIGHRTGTNTDSAVVPHIDMKIKWIDDSQGVPLDELKRTRQETEDVEENKTKSLIIFDMKLVAVKHHRAWVDKADENSQSLAMYNAMRKTTKSEREAKDQITEQDNKYARNEGPNVENEKLSVKMCLTKVIHWNQAKFGADAEKHVSYDAKKTLVEVTQLLESVLEQSSKSGMIGLTFEALKTKPQMQKVHQIKERREVLEKPQEHSKEDGKDDNDDLRNFAARFNSLQLEQDTRSLETAQLESRAAEEAKDEEATKNELIIGQQAKHADVLKLQEIMTCGKLYPINVAITKRTMKFTWW